MEIGIHLASTRAEAAPEVARLAEQLGFRAVWAPEHLVFPATMPNRSPLGPTDHPYLSPDLPIHDVLLLLGQIAAATQTIRLGTCVYILPLRHPIIVARTLMSLDVFSRGRVDFGIGVGWLPEEFQFLGIDWKTRGARTDEMIRAMRALWTESTITFAGEHFRFGPLKFEPKPVQPGGPPILVGGHSEAALRRAARLGDGWIGMGIKPEQVPELVARLRSLRDQFGRSGPFRFIVGAGNPDLDTVRRYEDAGIDALYVNLWRRTSEAREAMERYAEQVLQRLQ